MTKINNGRLTCIVPLAMKREREREGERDRGRDMLGHYDFFIKV